MSLTLFNCQSQSRLLACVIRLGLGVAGWPRESPPAAPLYRALEAPLKDGQIGADRSAT